MRFKVQNAVDEAAQVAAYVDARLVFDRLDRVCGERWSAAFEHLHERPIPPPVNRSNQGDTVRLSDAQGNVIDQVVYQRNQVRAGRTIVVGP